MTESPCIEIEGLTRTFSHRIFLARRPITGTIALDHVNLIVEYGEVHGLLGPNGAGKTTLCKILATILLPTAGTVTVCGSDVVTDPRAVRRRIGIVLGGDRGLYGRLTARQNLRHWGALYGLHGTALRSRIDELTERFGLTTRQHDRVETFSRGMKQRVHLARGLIADPELLLLDEPTDGLDPVAATEFRALVGQLRAEGRTILLTTHNMAEAEQVCDRVSFIDNGTILDADPATLSALVSRYERIDALGVTEPTRARVSTIAGVERVEDLPDGYVRFHATDRPAATAVLRALVDAEVTRIRNSEPSLEEIYLHLMGGQRGMRVD
ncbi:ABC transporter [Actinophytocola xinjiangensis]|uniref:ABC transporter n=1 Tax=Actinophytocola xinjiangensis TaxID=485602 RepID=A0A7Z0WSL9_9PSEU|nr:ABC transporter ATP-binding protein [Actinophytocola xinjiangensis]OLF13982.1 ABC transporter [Actinophytocola xinjiangensis]